MQYVRFYFIQSEQGILEELHGDPLTSVRKVGKKLIECREPISGHKKGTHSFYSLEFFVVLFYTVQRQPELNALFVYIPDVKLHFLCM